MLEIQDHYFHQAKKEGYVARSAFKLQELDEKFKIFGPQTRTVIDIGCAPGSWLQYVSKVLHKNKGKKEPLVLGFDLKQVHLNLPYTKTFVQDITNQNAVKAIINEELGIINSNLINQEGETQNPTIKTQNNSIDIIISDMAPNTVGNKGTDALRASYLVMETMRMYEQLLKPDGKFAIKVFMGPGFEELVKYCRTRRGNANIKIFKPKACRKESKETYIVKI